MPTANPFYVDKQKDYSQGLTGLSQSIDKITQKNEMQAAQKKQAERIQAGQQAAIQAYESGDPDQIAKVSIQYPEIAQQLQKSSNFRDQKDEAEYLTVLSEAYINPTIEGMERLDAMKQGLGHTTGKSLADSFNENPEAAKNQAGMELATRYPDRWKIYKADATKDTRTSEIKNYEYGIENPDFKKAQGEDEPVIYSKAFPDGSVRSIKNVKPGSTQEKNLIRDGFEVGTRTTGIKPSAKERAQEKINDATDKLTAMANEDPNEFYKKHSYRQNDDGSLFIDPVSGGPEKLKSFEKYTGKRGNIKAIVGLGEQRDDAIELTELLELPSVQANLKKAQGQGFWDQAKSKWENTINKWMQDQGIKGDSPTATAIARIQRMASEERKLYMGTAVTDNEMRSALAWMPNAGDSFDSVMNKTRLMGKEADQAFRRYVDLFEQAGADMSPFMNAFGIEKFSTEQEPAGEPQAKIKFLGFE